MARRPDPSIRPRIIEKAEHLIHLQGYNGTSLDDIATACDTTKAGLIHHFKSKEDLCLAVLDYKMERTRSECLEPLSCCDCPIRAVKKMFADAVCFYKGNGCRAGCFIGNIALEMSDINERFRTKAEAFFHEWTRCLEISIKRARAAGTFSKAIKPKATAEAILSLYQGAIMLARTQREPAIIERVGHQAIELLENHFSSNRTKEVSHHGS